MKGECSNRGCRREEGVKRMKLDEYIYEVKIAEKLESLEGKEVQRW